MSSKRRLYSSYKFSDDICAYDDDDGFVEDDDDEDNVSLVVVLFTLLVTFVSELSLVVSFLSEFKLELLAEFSIFKKKKKNK
jgi:hypothetical protein